MLRASSTRWRLNPTSRRGLPLIFMLLFAAGVRAQIGNTGVDDDRASGMRSGTNTIVGEVIFPSGYQPGKRCTVRLSSVRVGEFSTLTDDSGVFTFRRLREGSYFITVEAGKEFFPAQETVDLYDNRGQTATVQIELRLRPNANTKPAVLNAALAGVPKAAAELYEKGLAASAAGDNKKAIDELKQAVALYPAFVQALNELSVLYVNENDLVSAEQALVAALKHEPNNATLRLNYGYILLLRDQFVDAERQLHQAVQLNDKSLLAHLYRGRVLIRLARLPDAELELKKALSLGGNNSVLAYRYLGELYSEQRENTKAIEALEKYIKLRPDVKDREQIQDKIKQLREQGNAKNN